MARKKPPAVIKLSDEDFIAMCEEHGTNVDWAKRVRHRYRFDEIVAKFGRVTPYGHRPPYRFSYSGEELTTREIWQRFGTIDRSEATRRLEALRAYINTCHYLVPPPHFTIRQCVTWYPFDGDEMRRSGDMPKRNRGHDPLGNRLEIENLPIGSFDMVPPRPPSIHLHGLS